MRIRPRRTALAASAAAAALAALTLAATAPASGSPAASAPKLAIKQVSGSSFPDPKPVTPEQKSGPRYFYSTAGNKGVLVCPRDPETSCSQTQQKVKLEIPAHTDGSYICSFSNRSVFRYSSGNSTKWYLTPSVKVAHKKAGCKDNSWGVVLLFKPDTGKAHQGDNAVPYHYWVWTKKTLLGSLTHPNHNAGYAAHLERSGSTVALIYAEDNGCRIGLYAERVDPATMKPNTSSKTELLSPGISGNRDLNSEIVHSDRHGCKLYKVETGYIKKINGTYVMGYSVGSYNGIEYKIGLAYSKTFLGHYQKAVRHVTNGAWGSEKTEVNYVVQSEKPKWCHYETTAWGPGVPSLVPYNHKWYMYFAAHPGAKPKNGTFSASTRTPFDVPLTVKKKFGSLSKANRFHRQTWIEPDLSNGHPQSC
ncbi:hypothetical protein [Jatrophihabitans endophyticus]|uniref:hypothetical protein n=1 Tax=Jatrophihabitans endophyticus TaxID=1206085 RepID=UPI0019E847C2|nr:hypothetical protein [Jatrophihabitans endophyticus]MBE7187013.1 hypothetical protein [Jatrophihabitans endophyticus]